MATLIIISGKYTTNQINPPCVIGSDALKVRFSLSSTRGFDEMSAFIETYFDCGFPTLLNVNDSSKILKPAVRVAVLSPHTTGLLFLSSGSILKCHPTQCCFVYLPHTQTHTHFDPN